jgi:hypothetical protein
MIQKKAEVSPITIILAIVIIGLLVFFTLRFFVFKKNTPAYNVSKLDNSTVVSTAIKFISKSGAINITDGMNLTVPNQIVNVSTNISNKTLIKVIYPNHTMTPGVIMSTNVTEICKSGYADSVRNIPQKTINLVYEEYKLSTNQPAGAFQIDELIPIQLGGSNDIKTLWPQPGKPIPGYNEKDILEDYYYKQVCAGKMSLQSAQEILSTNWIQGFVDAYEAGGIK